MAPTKAPNKRRDEASVRGLQRLIALKYDRDDKRGTRGKPKMIGLRVKDLMRLLHHRMQHGREISRVIISHLAQMPNASERVEAFGQPHKLCVGACQKGHYVHISPFYRRDGLGCS